MMIAKQYALWPNRKGIPIRAMGIPLVVGYRLLGNETKTINGE